MALLDLRKGLTDNSEYKAFKFHGGEVHFKLKKPEVLYTSNQIRIISRLNNSDELMLLMLVIDTIRKDRGDGMYVEVFIPYMAYQQADRDFSVGESFSLKTVIFLLNSLSVNKFIVYDPHSDVTPALLRNCSVIDNSDFVRDTVDNILFSMNTKEEDLIMLSPDAGAYKKIGKLTDKISFKGELVAANKYREISTGDIQSLELSKQDFNSKDVLIVDDICVGGRTFVELAKKLKERNAGNLYLAISHGVFSNGLKELNQYFTKIFVTNSRLDYLKDREFSFLHDKEMEKLNVYNLS